MSKTKFAAAARTGAIAAVLSAAAAASVAGFAGAVPAASAQSADHVAGMDGDLASWAVRRHHFGTPPPAPDAPAPGANPGAAPPQAAPGMYGNPGAAAPYWRAQHSSDCVEMAVADVVGQMTGSEPSEQQIVSVAENTPSRYDRGPVYQGSGTDFRDVPTLLAHYGISSQLTSTSISGLEQDLTAGRKVIASVNGETIWRNGRGPANHAVTVTGIDTGAGVVHLNDSGIGSGRDEQVPITTFERAWATSGNQIAVTN